MPRAPLNTTATFYKGSGQPMPGTIRFSGPVRFVRVDGVFMVGAGNPQPIGWLTTDLGEPVGMWTPTLLGVDPRLSDQVSVPADGDIRYWVLYSERIIWRGADYYRAILADLPYPDFCNCGGPIPDPSSGTSSGGWTPGSFDLRLVSTMLDASCTDCNELLTSVFLPRVSDGAWQTSLSGCGGSFVISVLFTDSYFYLTLTHSPSGAMVTYKGIGGGYGPWRLDKESTFGPALCGWYEYVDLVPL